MPVLPFLYTARFNLADLSVVVQPSGILSVLSPLLGLVRETDNDGTLEINDPVTIGYDDLDAFYFGMASAGGIEFPIFLYDNGAGGELIATFQSLPDGVSAEEFASILSTDGLTAAGTLPFELPDPTVFDEIVLIDGGGTATEVPSSVGTEFILAGGGEDGILTAFSTVTLLFDSVIETGQFIGVTVVDGVTYPVIHLGGGVNIIPLPTGSSSSTVIGTEVPIYPQDYDLEGANPLPTGEPGPIPTFEMTQFMEFLPGLGTFGPVNTSVSGGAIDLADFDGLLNTGEAVIDGDDILEDWVYVGVTNVDGVAYPVFEVTLPGGLGTPATTVTVVGLPAGVDPSGFTGTAAQISPVPFEFDGSTVPPSVPLSFEASLIVEVEPPGFGELVALPDTFLFVSVDGEIPLGTEFTFNGTTITYLGTFTAEGGELGLVMEFMGAQVVFFEENPGDLGSQAFNLDASDAIICFAEGTRILTTMGEVAVEDLNMGDMVLSEDRRLVPVKWIGRQTVSTRFGPAERLMPVRVRAGALGYGLPLRDLVLTADHALLIDGLLINAGALVNGTSIDWVPLSELGNTYTVYHIETEAHDVILAEGAPAETYIDYAARRAFDNYAEYVDMYGDDRTIPEMAYPRVSSARMLPQHLKARLRTSPAA